MNYSSTGPYKMPESAIRYFDTHCHLLLMEEAHISLDTAVSHALESGVVRLLDISVGIADFFTRSDAIDGLRERFSVDMYMTAGIPPYFSDKREHGDIDMVKKQALTGNVPAIGEIGLDYFHDYGSHCAQIELFTCQIDLANKLGLPVVIHTRDSDRDLVHTLKTSRAERAGIIHCFSSGPETAKKLLDLGFYLSFAGNVTYNKSEHIREVLRIVPANRFVVETDSPYLSPKGLRGRPNEPANIVTIARFIAEYRGVSIEELAEQTWKNARHVLGI